MRDTDWMEDAACKGLPDIAFFPPSESIVQGYGYSMGKKVCMGCPVRIDCLKWATKMDIEYGLYGGKTPQERRKRSDMLEYLDAA